MINKSEMQERIVMSVITIGCVVFLIGIFAGWWSMSNG